MQVDTYLVRGREKWYGLGNSREAHLWNVRKQGLGVTHDWTVK